MVVVGGAALWWSGSLDTLTDMDLIQAKIEAAGYFAPVLYGLIMLVSFPILLAGPVVWVSVSLWSFPIAFLYAYLASNFVGWVFFAATRHFGRDWAASRIPEKMRRYEEKLESNPARTIILLRLLLWINPAFDMLIGATSISTRTYVVSTALILIPMTLGHLIIVQYLTS